MHLSYLKLMYNTYVLLSPPKKILYALKWTFELASIYKFCLAFVCVDKKMEGVKSCTCYVGGRNLLKYLVGNYI